MEQIAFWAPLVLLAFIALLFIAVLTFYGLFESGWIDFLLPTK